MVRVVVVPGLSASSGSRRTPARTPESRAGRRRSWAHARTARGGALPVRAARWGTASVTPMELSSVVVAAGRPHEPGGSAEHPDRPHRAVPARRRRQPLRPARRVAHGRGVRGRPGRARGRLGAGVRQRHRRAGHRRRHACRSGRPWSSRARPTRARCRRSAPRPSPGRLVRAGGRHRRHRRGRRGLRRRRPGLARDGVEPVDDGGRPARPSRGGRPRRRCAGRHRRDVLDAAGGAPAGARRRHRHALGHEVPVRPLRRADGRAGRPLARAAHRAARPPDARRRDPRRAGGLPRHPRRAHAGAADGARAGQRAGPRAAAGRAPRGGPRALPRPARRPRPRRRGPRPRRLRGGHRASRCTARPRTPSACAPRCG